MGRLTGGRKQCQGTGKSPFLALSTLLPRSQLWSLARPLSLHRFSSLPHSLSPKTNTMSTKHNDGLDDLFAGLPETSTPPAKAPVAADDPLADLNELESLAERPKPVVLSRPSTPRSGPKRSLERSRTPGSGYGLPLSARTSSEAKRSTDPGPSTSSPPQPQLQQQQQQAEAAPAAQVGGGWGWGTLWSTATTAVKAAEGLVQEIQQSEEGKKWVTQVKGNAGALRGLGIPHHLL